MENDKILAWLESERLSVADFLEGLDESEWDVQSACEAWTIRELAAHLTLSTREGWGSTLWGVLKARGNWNRMTENAAKKRAARFTPAELIAQIRETAGSEKRSPGAGPLDPLVDFLVHGQDLARPLGREREMPIEPTVAALGHVWDNRFYGRHFKGKRVVVTDAEWSVGEGPEVRGTAAELLLAATGR